MKKGYSILFFLFFLAINLVSADLGPKPSAKIHVLLNGQSVQDTKFNAKMLSCYDKDHLFPDKDVIPQLNISEYDSENNCYWKPAQLAWGGDCRNGKCHFNYFLPSEFRLAVYLPSQDKVYLSQNVTRENFRSTYNANLLPDGSINLQETIPFFQMKSLKILLNFFIALILTLNLEIIIALIYLSIKKISKKVLISVLIVNCISLPIVWFVFPLLRIIPFVILLGEIFAFIFESYFINLLNKDNLPLKNSFILSLLMNLASLIIGGVIFLFVSKILSTIFYL